MYPHVQTGRYRMHFPALSWTCPRSSWPRSHLMWKYWNIGRILRGKWNQIASGCIYHLKSVYELWTKLLLLGENAITKCGWSPIGFGWFPNRAMKVPWAASMFMATSYYSVHPLIWSATHINPVHLVGGGPVSHRQGVIGQNDSFCCECPMCIKPRKYRQEWPWQGWPAFCFWCAQNIANTILYILSNLGFGSTEGPKPRDLSSRAALVVEL